MPSTKNYTSPAIELIEYFPGKVYFVSSSSGPPQISDGESDFVDYLHMQKEFRYTPFYLDYGPLNLGLTFMFAAKLDAKLKLHEQSDIRTRICVYSSNLPRHRVSAVCILACWGILSRGWSAETAFAPFQHLVFLPFHDATRGVDRFGLTILDVLQGFERALKNQLFSPQHFDVDKYFHDGSMDQGDITWLSPKFVAFAGPRGSSDTGSDHNKRMLSWLKPPKHYVAYFLKHNIRLVIRLSKKRYNEAVFCNAGIEFVDLYFPDGSCPPDALLGTFLAKCEQSVGPIAVHCKAGLGRTGTLVACYLMKHHRFTAEEAIGWLRLSRPGSVIGRQQHFLRAKQQLLWDYPSSSPSCGIACSSNRVISPMGVELELRKSVLQPFGKQEEAKSIQKRQTRGIAARRMASESESGLLMKAGQFRLNSALTEESKEMLTFRYRHSISHHGSTTLPPRIPRSSLLPTSASEAPGTKRIVCFSHDISNKAIESFPPTQVSLL